LARKAVGDFGAKKKPEFLEEKNSGFSGRLRPGNEEENPA
jgi:hypothetical protein